MIMSAEEAAKAAPRRRATTAKKPASPASTKGESRQRAERLSDELPWSERPFVHVALATQVSGLSATTLYRMAEQGRLVFKRLAGRVLIETPSLVQLVNSAEPWVASDRGKAARAKRSELARANWRAGGAV